jgi:hypothetical protein
VAGLVLAREEDRVIVEAKRPDPAIRGRRQRGDAIIGQG